MTANDLTHGHFRTLGLNGDASDSEIQDAYYRLVRAHHPDRNQGDPQAEVRFKKVQLAYETLSKRRIVEKPPEYEQFPFIATDSPRFEVRWLCLVASIAAVVIAVTLMELLRNSVQTAAGLPVGSSSPGQASNESHASVALSAATPPSAARSITFGRETVTGENSIATDLQRASTARPETVETVIDTVQSASKKGSTAVRPTPSRIKRSAEKITLDSARQLRDFRTPKYPGRTKKSVTAPVLYGERDTENNFEHQIVLSSPEPSEFWETLDQSTDRQISPDDLAKWNHGWILPGKSLPPNEETSTARSPGTLDKATAPSTTTDWGHANGSREQPLTSLNVSSSSFESLFEVHSPKGPKATSRPKLENRSLSIWGLPKSSGEAGLAPIKKASPRGTRGSSRSWDPSHASNFPSHEDLPWYESPSERRNSGGTSSNHSMNRAEQRLPHWSTSRLWNSSLPSEPVWAGSRSSYRAPTASRIDVHKKILPPYNTKTLSPGGQGRAYQKTLPNIGPAKPSSAPRATAAWQPLGASW